MPKRLSTWALLIVFLLVGMWLRVEGITPMSDMLHHDEAVNGLDALSLVENPRLTAYFPANNGRESLWMYALAPSVAVFGATPFALRIVAIFTSILTLAAVYALAVEFTDKRSAVWSVGALSVVYWAMHIGHVAFRVNLFLLIGTLALAALLRARRLNRGWWLAGILIGATFYTYLAGRAWLLLMGVLLVWWLIRLPKHRRGVLVASVSAIVVMLPLALTLLTASENTAHIQSVFVEDFATLRENTTNWLEAWLVAGDPNANHNLPERPILDVFLAALTIIGFAVGWRKLRDTHLALLWLLLTALSLAPSLLAIQTPHFLRGAGLLIPLALLLGAGAGWLAQWRVGAVVALGLLLAAGTHTSLDFQTWLDTEEISYYIDPRINEAMSIINAQTDPAQPLVVPGLPFHPTIAYRAAAHPQRALHFYEWQPGGCALSPRRDFIALDLPSEVDSYSERVQPSVQSLELVAQHPDHQYHIYAAEPLPILADDWQRGVIAGEQLTLQAIAPDDTRVQAGDTLAFEVALRVQQPLTREYQLFVHLYPPDSRDVLSNGDTALCPLAYDTYGAPRDDSVTLVQTVRLPVPPDVSAGEYRVGIGVYHLASGDVLPLRDIASDNAPDFYDALPVTVTEPNA